MVFQRRRCGVLKHRVFQSKMADSKKKLNVAMIGHGFIARAHANAFHQVQRFFPIAYDLNLSVICGRNRPKLDAMASEWGWQEVATDWQEVVDRSDIQILDIAVPNVLHAPIAMAAAQAGKIIRSEEHTSELQSPCNLVCRLLLEKKKK